MFADRTTGARESVKGLRRGRRSAAQVRRAAGEFARRGALALLLLAGGCSLTPEGAREEEARLAEAGRVYEAPVEERELPGVPDAPTWEDVLRRAFLANGELEGAYFDWKAAVVRIGIASAYPNSNISLGYSYMFSSERMKTFDRQTFAAGFDSSMNLSFPTKVAQEGKIALDEARASGERFRAAKFELQRRVLGAWSDYVLLAERLRIQKEQLALGRMSLDAALVRSRGGTAQRDALRLEVAIRTMEDAIRSNEAELTAARAMLNGMLAREGDAPLAAPGGIPPPRDMPGSDDIVLASAVERNPELAALAQVVAGRSDALELARLQWIPDISPTVMFTGGISQAIGAAITLPSNVAQIRGGISEAEAMLRGSEAVLRQTRSDRAATLVATLVLLRNSERQAEFFEREIVPIAGRLAANARQSYARGAGGYVDLLDAERTLLDARLVVAEARTAREKRLAELESLMGVDIETLGGGEAPAGEPVLLGAGRVEEDDHEQD